MFLSILSTLDLSNDPSVKQPVSAMTLVMSPIQMSKQLKVFCEKKKFPSIFLGVRFSLLQ